MAVVSENTLYKERIVPSYVSSSGYYGYVPPCPALVNYGLVQNSRIGECVVVGSNEQSTTCENGSWASMLQRNRNNDNNDGMREERSSVTLAHGSSAMETDDFETFHSDEYVGVSRCQNNRCVIPESSSGQERDAIRVDSARYWENGLYRVTAEFHEDSKMRGNRKRAGDDAYLVVGHNQGFTKKFKQDGGNSNIIDDKGNPGKCGSTTLHYEPTSSVIGSGNFVIRPIDDPAKSILSNGRKNISKKIHDDEKFGDSLLDYEIMLMETHGCSAYHYNRYRSPEIALTTETEF